jgi:DNA polymerase-3 subunit gamma/tau
VNSGLALRYRPSTFDEILGQRLTATVLTRMVEKDQIPPGLLFSGPSGTGKTSAARVFARELNLGEEHDVIEMDAASNGGVEAIRHLIETLRYGHTGRYRVVILDEAHSVTEAGFNALLKTLEEPPAGTVFILVTTEPERILKTVRSRLMEFSFQRLAPGDIYTRLTYVDATESLGVSVEVLRDIAHRADGSARVGLMLLEQAAIAEVQDLDAWRALLGEDDIAPALLAACASGRHDVVFATLDQVLERISSLIEVTDLLVRCMRDLLILRAGGTLTATGASLDSRKALAQQLETERIFAATRLLWDLKTRVRGVQGGAASLEHALILVAEILTRGKQESPAVQPQNTTTAGSAPAPSPKKSEAAPRLSLAQMRG